MQFSVRTQNLHSSPIREILSVLDRPGMISFAGGLPATESFPRFSLHDMPQSMLQYGASEGETELRRQIAGDLQEMGMECTENQILITSGSQQGIDLIAKLFIDTDTPVAVEAPTYLAALQVFRYFGARFVPYDIKTLDTEKLKDEKPAFLYSIPTFQNPTGHCLNFDERAKLAACCDSLMLTLYEDDPYRDLVYDPCERRPVCSFLKKAPWIYQGSFSKKLAPALRLGYLAVSPEFIPFLTRLKQAADLHSNRISQWLVLQQLNHAGREERLDKLVQHYRVKRDDFESALCKYFSGLAHWEKPAGGLFFWLKLNKKIDTRKLLAKAIEENIAFMPGEPFFPFPVDCSGQIRLNFSHASKKQAELGIGKLADLVQNFKE